MNIFRLFSFFKFLTYIYFKLFVIIFLSLETFFVAMESVKYGEDLPSSANLVTLFLFYDSIYALTYTVPISLILSAIAFYINLLRSGYFSTLLSLGYSRIQILYPMLIVATLAICSHLLLNATPLAYAQEKVEQIIYGNTALSTRSNIFLKHNNQYIYLDTISPIYPDGARATNIRVYEVNDDILTKYYEAEEAYFLNNHWTLNNTNLITIQKNLHMGNKVLDIKNIGNANLLEGFRPKILDAITKDRPVVSIIDGIEALKISHAQNTSSQKIRSVLYGMILVPFFVPLVIIILSYFIPPLARYGNLNLIGFLCIVIGLSAWSIMYAISQLSGNGAIIPEIGILIPFFILLVISIIFKNKLRTKM